MLLSWFFIILLLFLTPLFHRPISEKHPYGFFQLESFFILIKNIMLISVTLSVLTSVIEKLLSGGSQINKGQVSLFQLILGSISFFILLIMKFMSRKVSSPTVKAEILGGSLMLHTVSVCPLLFLLPLNFKTPHWHFCHLILIRLLQSWLCCLWFLKLSGCWQKPFGNYFFFHPIRKLLTW